MVVTKKLCTFALAFETYLKSLKARRDGRVVDYSSLENYRTERYRGFESLSLRKTKGDELKFNELPFNFCKKCGQNMDSKIVLS